LIHSRLLRSFVIALGAAVLVLQAGCSHKSSSAPLGVGIGVTLATSNPNGNVLNLGQSVTLTAGVLNDPKNLGVSWSVLPATPIPPTAVSGGLSAATKNTVVYTAPTVTDPITLSKSGEAVVSVTATAVADPTKFITTSIIANGTPLIPATTLLPGNQNVGYLAYVSVVGGTAPYVWTLQGSLPAGLSLGNSTGTVVTISGTPTTVSASPPPKFTITVADANKNSASALLSIKVHLQTGCIIDGPFAFGLTGYAFAVPGERAASITIASDGTITGIQDYKDLHGVRVAEPITSGQCYAEGANRVHLQLISPSGETAYEAGLMTSLFEGRIIEADGSSMYGVGRLLQQPVPEPPLAALAGDYTIGLVGSDSTGRRRGLVGRLTLDAAGNVSGGEFDSNGLAPKTAAALTGHFNAPDAVHGRGTATLNAAGEILTLAYYVMDIIALDGTVLPGSHRLFLANIDASNTSSRLSGSMYPQFNAGTFDVNGFVGNWVFDFSGSTGITLPLSSTSLARIDGSTVNTGKASASVFIDTVDLGTPVVSSPTPAGNSGTLTVAANGRVTYVVPSAPGGTRSFVFYLGSTIAAPPANTPIPAGVMIETTGSEAGFGEIALQPTGFLSNFTGGTYIGATLLPGAVAPMTMLPTQSMTGGTFGGNITGVYALDPVAGRGIGIVTQDLLGGIGTVFYVVSANHVVMMGNGVNALNSTIVMLDY